MGICFLFMDGPIHRARSNTPRFQLRGQFFAALCTAIDEPRCAQVQVVGEELDAGYPSQPFGIADPDFFLALNAAGQLSHLSQAHAGLQFGELEVVADAVMNISAAGGAAEVLQPAQLVGQCIVICYQCAALAG